jgi:hypothetical protein
MSNRGLLIAKKIETIEQIANAVRLRAQGDWERSVPTLTKMIELLTDIDDEMADVVDLIEELAASLERRKRPR